MPVPLRWDLWLLVGVGIDRLGCIIDGRWRLAPLRKDLLSLVCGIIASLERVGEVLDGLIVGWLALCCLKCCGGFSLGVRGVGRSCSEDWSCNCVDCAGQSKVLQSFEDGLGGSLSRRLPLWLFDQGGGLHWRIVDDDAQA